MVPEHVFLYRAPTTACDVQEIAGWLDGRVEADVSVRERFLDRFQEDEMTTAFARARVLSPFERETGSTMHGIVKYEERAIADPTRSGGVLYDGMAIQRALNGAIPAKERSLRHLHIAVLDRHLGTWGDHDGRWHKRIAVLGQPALISVPGLAEAPAKPEAYYALKQQHAMIGGGTPPREVLDEAIDEDVIVPGDPRTTDALKGYALAAVHLLATGEAFCASAECRLYNGHRHQEVIQAQLEPPTFCPAHRSAYTTS